MTRLRLRYIILIIGILLVLGGELTAWSIENDFGGVNSEIITLKTNENTNIEAKLQIPKIASSSNPLPAVIVIHGSMQSKEWLATFGIELVRRDIIVLSFDAAGHGNSEPTSGDLGGIVALEFLAQQSYVSKIGMCGHSMGAGLIISALESSIIEPNSVVFVGGGGSEISGWANETTPKNLLITVGRYDELFNIPGLLSALKSVFGTINDVESGVLYGSFSTESARKLVIGGTNHLFETLDPFIIGETVAWFVNSFNAQDSGLLDSDIPLSYPLYLIADFIGVVGINLSIFPLIVILMEIPAFKPLRKQSTSSYEASTKNCWIFGIIYGLISLGSFIPALLLPSIPFPQRFGGTIGIWLIGNAAIALAILFVFQRKKMKDISFSNWDIDTHAYVFIVQLGRAAALTLIVGIWIHIWVTFVDLFFLKDIRVFLPFFQDLTLERISIIPLYLIFTIPFFIVEGIWLAGFLRRSRKETWYKTYINQTFSAIIIKCVPYLIILLVQVIMGLILGGPFIKGIFGYYLLFFWMFGPMFVITTAFLLWSHYLTDRIYIGATFNALIFSWGMATILAFSF